MWLGGVLMVVACGGFVSRIQAATLNILPFGDSITKGVYDSTTNNNDPTLGGYRSYLEMLLQDAGLVQGTGYDMVGDFLDSATPGYDQDHYGSPGAQAAQDTDYGGGNIVKSIKYALDNNLAFNPGTVQPNRVLLHIGTNTVNGDGNSVTAPTTGANAQFDALMGSIRSRYDNGDFAADAQFVLGLNMGHNSYIWPQAWASGSNLRNTVANVFAYNQHIRDYVAGLLNGDTEDQAFASHLSIADMFAVALADLKLDWLADLFTSGDQLLLESMIDPDDDGYVDWVNHLDETDATFSLISGNMSDYLNAELQGWRILHPEDLGYAIMANVWFNSMSNVPEPMSLVLLSAGAVLMAARRRRGAAA
jgi:hypothetical protein